MASKSSSITAILVLLATFLLILAPNAEARPTAIGASRLDARAAGSTTFTTKDTKTDSNGQVFTESCTVVLTPVTVNGQDEVQEIRACNTAPGTTDPGPPPAPPTDQTSATGGATSAPAGTATTPAATSAAGSATQASATATASAASVPAAAFSIIGDSSIVISSATAAAATSAASASATGAASASITGSAPAAVSTAPTSASGSAATPSPEGASVTGSASATASAAASSTSPAAQFSLPGKTLSVLPIGLGVFAGISVIALIVVGLVTYERTKYRKAFRARKLAEAGGGMGYGGMAEARV